MLKKITMLVLLGVPFACAAPNAAAPEALEADAGVDDKVVAQSLTLSVTSGFGRGSVIVGCKDTTNLVTSIEDQSAVFGRSAARVSKVGRLSRGVGYANYTGTPRVTRIRLKVNFNRGCSELVHTQYAAQVEVP